MSRINARLDADMARKLEEIRARTSASTTEIVVAALTEYHGALERQPGARAYEIFEEAGFVGCADGPRDLASDTKRYLDFGGKHRPPTAKRRRKR